jgi:hypothetical protein
VRKSHLEIQKLTKLKNLKNKKLRKLHCIYFSLHCISFLGTVFRKIALLLANHAELRYFFMYIIRCDMVWCTIAYWVGIGGIVQFNRIDITTIYKSYMVTLTFAMLTGKSLRTITLISSLVGL